MIQVFDSLSRQGAHGNGATAPGSVNTTGPGVNTASEIDGGQSL